MKKMALGDLHLASTGETVYMEGQTGRKVDQSHGTGALFCVSSPDWVLSIAHCRWDNGDQDVRLYDCGTAPRQFDRFRGTCRLGLNPRRRGTPIERRELCVKLMQARMGEDDHPQLRKADLPELSEPAGCDVGAVLAGMGARIGTCESLMGNTGGHKFVLCAAFHRCETDVAVVAYVLTRIAPFYREIRIEQD